MKYVYFYLWVFLATIHIQIARTFFCVNKLIFKIRKTSDADQKAWLSNYNRGFLEFPGGMLEWYASGLTLLLVLAIWIPALFYFDVGEYVLKSKTRIYIFVITIAAVVYYRIYFVHISWLTKKICRINKSYYLS